MSIFNTASRFWIFEICSTTLSAHAKRKLQQVSCLFLDFMSFILNLGHLLKVRRRGCEALSFRFLHFLCILKIVWRRCVDAFLTVREVKNTHSESFFYFLPCVMATFSNFQKKLSDFQEFFDFPHVESQDGRFCPSGRPDGKMKESASHHEIWCFSIAPAAAKMHF